MKEALLVSTFLTAFFVAGLLVGYLAGRHDRRKPQAKAAIFFDSGEFITFPQPEMANVLMAETPFSVN